MYSFGRIATVFASLLIGVALAQAQVPAGYPAEYKAILDGAKKEGKVVVYSTTDAKLVTPLLKDFEAAFPGVKVEYTDLNSTERSLKVQSSTGTMLERVSSGENLIGYNVLGSYALTRAKKDPSMGIAFTTDYNLVLSRLVFVSKNAKNPNAGRLWLDYLLSKRGQTITAEQAELYSVRTDISGKDSGVAFAKELGSAVKPIAVSDELLVGLDQTKRLEFLKRWQTALARK